MHTYIYVSEISGLHHRRKLSKREEQTMNGVLDHFPSYLTPSYLLLDATCCTFELPFY